ncbi:MAG: Zn-dependent hydrolase [Inquilinus sp.]|nr:Zn-dependent hydrolase [Inquilinus sp.]
MHNLTINAERLWETLMETARIGGTPKGGIKRLTLTDLDREVRDWFVAKCEAAGCSVGVDEMGNIYALRPGKDDSLPPIVCGSHLDTQPTGGKYDGVLGVLAGLEVIRTLNDSGYETNRPIMVVDWTNEEGSRFAPAMISSGVFGGAFDLDYAYGRADPDGETLGAELERIGYKGKEKIGEREFGAFFELHIEQGPVLEAEEKTIGVVTDAQGQRWYELTVSGQESHAGTTPMPLRRDAMMGAAKMIAAVQEIALRHAPHAVGTVGMVRVEPNSRNVIPGEVFFTVDIRHPDDTVLAAMDRELRAACGRIAEAAKLTLAMEQIWHFPPVAFDADCVAAVRQAAEESGHSHRDIISGAGHDACYVARVAPTSMIFVPCENGISHNEIENATFDDVAAGANVLLRAMVAMANA